MRRWLCLVALFGVSGVVCAQQNHAPPSSPPSSPSDSQDASGLSRDTTFPGDRPANSPANSVPADGDTTPKKRAPSMAPPRSDRVQVDDLGTEPGQSSSKDTQADLSPPADDAKAHPQSSAAVAEAAGVLNGGVGEFKTWDPHKAAKSVEVGDFYFKRRNYRAAEERYREALRYKDNDAIATIRLAICLEKLGILDDARAEYERYLKILPHGPEAALAQKALDRLKVQTTGANKPQ